jgi:phosphoglycolate phosphatase-like HAD superfamily hydrolase
MVGDHAMDVAGGRAAGMRTALVTNGRPPEDLDRIAPDHVFETPAGLLDLL